MTFLNPRYEGLLRIDSITCIVDAVGIFADGDNERLNLLKLRQIGFADMVILNKTDLVEPAHIEVIREWLDCHMQRVRIVEATQCDVPLGILLAVGRFHGIDIATQPGHGGEPRHGHDGHERVFETWSYESDRPVSIEALRKMVQRDLPASVYRCKGIVFAADSPSRRFALQVVGRRTEISELDEWGQRTPRTRIVAIASSNEIDPHALTALFEGCEGGL